MAISRKVLQGKKGELVFCLLVYSMLLVASIALVMELDWAKPLAVVSLSALLLYVWGDNTLKILYFLQLKKGTNPQARHRLKPALKDLFGTGNFFVNDELFTEEFYVLAAQKNLRKSYGRMVVGTVLIGLCLWCLL